MFYLEKCFKGYFEVGLYAMLTQYWFLVLRSLSDDGMNYIIFLKYLEIIILKLCGQYLFVICIFLLQESPLAIAVDGNLSASHQVNVLQFIMSAMQSPTVPMVSFLIINLTRAFKTTVSQFPYFQDPMKVRNYIVRLPIVSTKSI